MVADNVVVLFFSRLFLFRSLGFWIWVFRIRSVAHRNLHASDRALTVSGRALYGF